MEAERDTLRARLERGDQLVGPGVYDALSARLCEEAGFPMAFLSGLAVAATRLGAPDIGLLTLTEVCDAARCVTRAVTIPLVVDGDTGYGNALNVMRTVRDVAAAGAAGILLEDQAWPKRCGHMSGKTVLSAEEHVQKLRAALDARPNADFLIFARTDARAPLGLDEAIRRGQLYKAAGADVVFVEAPQSRDELERIGGEVPGPLMANMLETGRTPEVPNALLRQWGYQVVARPFTMLFSATRAARQALRRLHDTGTAAGLEDVLLSFDEFNQLVSLDEMRHQEGRYADE